MVAAVSFQNCRGAIFAGKYGIKMDSTEMVVMNSAGVAAWVDGVSQRGAECR
jgi:hypothetical protein